MSTALFLSLFMITSLAGSMVLLFSTKYSDTAPFALRRRSWDLMESLSCHSNMMYASWDLSKDFGKSSAKFFNNVFLSHEVW